MLWLYALLSVFAVSLIAFIGIFTISLKIGTLKKLLLYLVSFSVGGLLGVAFLHLLPEAAENGLGMEISIHLLLGILLFFVVEKFIHWRHCHIPTSSEHPHPFAYINLIGDGVHNFIDGLIIAASYLTSVHLGIATTIAVIFHEIPQEIGDFGVLVYGGFARKRALVMNFLSALTAVLGAFTGLVLGTYIEGIVSFLLPFAAGGFVYIAGSDLIPELHKEIGFKKSATQFFMVVLGILVMYVLVLLE